MAEGSVLAHETPHEANECGDPEWCLHEEPTDRANLSIVTIPIPRATEPYLRVTSEAEPVVEAMHVDMKDMSVFLQRQGWQPDEAVAFLLVFMSPQQYKDQGIPREIEAFSISQDNMVNKRHDAENEDDLAVYDFGIVIPVSIDDLTPEGIAKLNNTLRHELGHMNARKKIGDRESLYSHLLDRDKEQDRPQKSFVQKLGTLSVRGYARFIQLRYGYSYLQALHFLDKEEQYCRAFEKEHADFNPISLKA